jgi:hypothetical protein
MKNFEQFIEEGLVVKRSPDLSRSIALKNEADDSYKIIQDYLIKFPLNDTNANHVIKNTYDIIMQLIRSKMHESGYKTTGTGAHAAEVAYLSKLGFNAVDLEFADKLRSNRNDIQYDGDSYNAEYASKVLHFLEKIRKKIV